MSLSSSIGPSGISGGGLSSIAPPQPHLDLGFDDLRSKMERFALAFDVYVARAKEEIIERKQDYLKAIAQDKDTTKRTQAEIAACREREMELIKSEYHPSRAGTCPLTS